MDRPRCRGPRPPVLRDSGWNPAPSGPQAPSTVSPASCLAVGGRGRGSALTPLGPRAHAPRTEVGALPEERGLLPRRRGQAPICSLVRCRRKETARLPGRGPLGRKRVPVPQARVRGPRQGRGRVNVVASFRAEECAVFAPAHSSTTHSPGGAASPSARGRQKGTGSRPTQTRGHASASCGSVHGPWGRT